MSPIAEFLRGAAWPGAADVAYPRAEPADASRLPIDTWATAQLPVGVRLEIVGTARKFEVDYTCQTDDLGYRGVGAGASFTVWQGDTKLDDVAASLSGGTVSLSATAASSDAPIHIHVPEGMKPKLLDFRALDGTADPAPAGPRWLAYGDSITEGWVASGPGMAWPAIAARKHGLDVVNLGYAGACRGEIPSAEQIAKLPADVISVFYGTNCWSRIPFSVEMLTAGFKAFLEVVRQGHPRTPIVVVSMIVRPDAETTPNRLGATMQDLRHAIEGAVRVLDDPHMSLVRGGDLVAGEQLPDGIHPGDEAQWILASAIGEAVVAALAAATT